MNFNEKNEVRVIGFVANKRFGNCGPVPDNYLSNEEGLPVELIDDMKKNGWSDEQGNIWWSEDYEPEPRLGNDGNVYLCLSDKDMEDPGRYLKRLRTATKMLVDFS
jgi:hypothetical protein